MKDGVGTGCAALSSIMFDPKVNALLLARSLFTLAALAALAASTTLATGCSSAPDEGVEASNAAVTEGRRTTTLHYLGSQRFLLNCAGNTLGCGQRVASVPEGPS